jgi:glutathione S-transferase
MEPTAQSRAASHLPSRSCSIGTQYDSIFSHTALRGTGRAYLTGAGFTIADAYFFTLANWAQFVGIDLAKWPYISGFMQRVAARPAVQEAPKAEGLKKAA